MKNKLFPVIITLAAAALMALLVLRLLGINQSLQPQPEDDPIPLEQFLSYVKKDGDTLVLPDLCAVAQQAAAQDKPQSSEELITAMHNLIRSGDYDSRRVEYEPQRVADSDRGLNRPGYSSSQDEAAMAAYKDMIGELFADTLDEVTIPAVESPFGAFGG